MLQLACPPMPVVRIGFVGLGNRGMATLRRYLVIDGVQIVALCDINQAHLAEAASLLHVDGQYSPMLLDSSDGWKQMCHRDDIDLIYIYVPTGSPIPLWPAMLWNRESMSLSRCLLPLLLTSAGSW